MRGYRYRSAGVPRHIHIIDLIGAQEGRIRHDRQIGAIQFPAYVNLLGDPGQELLQGLVYGIQGDHAFDAGVDIHVQLGIARQGEKQFLHPHIIDDDTISFGLGGGLWLRQGRGLPDGWGNLCRPASADFLCAQMIVAGWLDGRVAAG